MLSRNVGFVVMRIFTIATSGAAFHPQTPDPGLKQGVTMSTPSVGTPSGYIKY